MDQYQRQWISYLFLASILFQTLSLGYCQPAPGSSSDSLGKAATGDLASYENIFLQKLIKEYGTDGLVSVDQLHKLIKNIEINLKSNNHEKREDVHSQDVDHAVPAEKKSDKLSANNERESLAQTQIEEQIDGPVGNVEPCPDPKDTDCFVSECLTMDGIFKHHKISPNGSANGTNLEHMSPTILYQLQNPNCHLQFSKENHTIKARPKLSEVWGYGFLCVTLINLCALMGMVFLPLMQRSFYQKMLMFMVALAVGTLSGSALLFLIPESFEMTQPESEYNEIYVWRCLTVVGGIYLFFLTERLLKMIIKQKQGPDEEKEMNELPTASVPTHSVHRDETINMSFKPIPTNLQQGKNYQLRPDNSSAKLVEQGGENGAATGDTELQIPNGKPPGDGVVYIKSVAWMVIFGDGLHNFIDGLSIGAAFSGSVMTGVSVSLAVICEELPHELGDFAILLNSGMSMRQALGYNFLSACMCYLGLVIGILVGEATHGAVWIFAVAAGMFLYIALVDMLPEVNHAAEEEESATGTMWSVFFIQNAGLLTGIAIMVLLAVYSGKIDLSYVA